jgi:hypothetical protein
MKHREQLIEDMKTLAEMEFSNGTDNFKPIENILNVYLDKYGADKELNEFRSTYLEERHRGFYEEAKRREERKYDELKRWLD